MEVYANRLPPVGLTGGRRTVARTVGGSASRDAGGGLAIVVQRTPEQRGQSSPESAGSLGLARRWCIWLRGAGARRRRGSPFRTRRGP